MALIEAHNLEKTYHTGDVATHALRGVTFTINKGEFVAIMGPSGSGKSTLLHIIGLLDKHTGGTFKLEGKSFDDYSKDDIARIRNEKLGFVFQAFNLLPRTSVMENVILPLVYSDIKESEWEARAQKAIDAVGLTHRAHHKPSQLSGGEKQRAAIARALVMDAEIIFADEPTGNLDSKSGQKIMEILQRLNEEKGYTIVLITHETYTAEHAQRVIRLLDGQIESDKATESRAKATEFKK